MAIIKLGTTVVGIRGTVGGLTFSANKSGPYAKNWQIGPKTRTPAQTVQRNSLAEFASAWRDISGAQQIDWDTYAALPAQDLINSLGLPYSISGFNWFVKINTQLASAGNPQRDDAPTLTRPTAPIMESVRLGITGTGVTSLVNTDETHPEHGDDLVVYSAFFLSHGRLVQARPLQLLTVQIPDALGVINLTSFVQDTYGFIPDGSRIFYFSSDQDPHGQRGPVVENRTDAV